MGRDRGGRPAADPGFSVCEFFFWRDVTPVFTMTYGNAAVEDIVMDDTLVNVEELKRMLSGEIDALVAQVAKAMNTARAGGDSTGTFCCGTRR